MNMQVAEGVQICASRRFGWAGILMIEIVVVMITRCVCNNVSYSIKA